jgi:protein-S-isoprenylcysteine O-methyltransferase Ste14
LLWQILGWGIVALTAVVWYAVEIRWMIRQRRSGGKAVVVSERRSMFVILGLGVLGQAGGLLLMWLMPSMRIANNWAALAAAAMPAVWAGLAFRWWAIHTLGEYFRATVAVRERQPVIRTGPYRFVRHPSYTGGLMAVMAAALALNNAAAWLVLVACVLAGLLYRIRVEDAVLREHLGAEYVEYAARTARLVPGVW